MDGAYLTIKFLHIRELESLVSGEALDAIKPHGGVTVAYSVVDTPGISGICFNLAKCHPDDRFCYETGRQHASKKLSEEGPLEVLPLEHPISHTIIDYIANQWWPSRRKYGGYAIDVWPDDKFRWMSTFTPAQSYIEGDPAV